MENIVIAILIAMCIAGIGIMVLVIGGLIYACIWATIEMFKENIFEGLGMLFVSVVLIGFILITIIASIVKVYN